MKCYINITFSIEEINLINHSTLLDTYADSGKKCNCVALVVVAHFS